MTKKLNSLKPDTKKISAEIQKLEKELKNPNLKLSVRAEIEKKLEFWQNAL